MGMSKLAGFVGGLADLGRGSTSLIDDIKKKQAQDRVVAYNKMLYSPTPAKTEEANQANPSNLLARNNIVANTEQQTNPLSTVVSGPTPRNYTAELNNGSKPEVFNPLNNLEKLPNAYFNPLKEFSNNGEFTTSTNNPDPSVATGDSISPLASTSQSPNANSQASLNSVTATPTREGGANLYDNGSKINYLTQYNKTRDDRNNLLEKLYADPAVADLIEHNQFNNDDLLKYVNSKYPDPVKPNSIKTVVGQNGELFVVNEDDGQVNKVQDRYIKPVPRLLREQKVQLGNNPIIREFYGYTDDSGQEITTNTQEVKGADRAIHNYNLGGGNNGTADNTDLYQPGVRAALLEKTNAESEINRLRLKKPDATLTQDQIDKAIQKNQTTIEKAKHLIDNTVKQYQNVSSLINANWNRQDGKAKTIEGFAEIVNEQKRLGNLTLKDFEYADVYARNSWGKGLSDIPIIHGGDPRRDYKAKNK